MPTVPEFLRAEVDMQPEVVFERLILQRRCVTCNRTRSRSPSPSRPRRESLPLSDEIRRAHLHQKQDRLKGLLFKNF